MGFLDEVDLIHIEKNVPFEGSKYRKGFTKRIWDIGQKLLPGDSFLITLTRAEWATLHRILSRVLKYKIKVRVQDTENKVYRVWRIE